MRLLHAVLAVVAFYVSPAIAQVAGIHIYKRTAHTSLEDQFRSNSSTGEASVQDVEDVRTSRKKQPPAREISYTIEIIDGVRSLKDINRREELAVWLSGTESNHSPSGFVDKKERVIPFECISFDRPDERRTLAEAINNHGDIVGSCSSGTTSFVRSRSGILFQFSVPGADQTLALGINDRRQIVGQHINPFAAPNVSGFTRFHSFLRSPEGQYTTIAVPAPHPDDTGIPNPFVFTVAQAINNRGQIVGTFETVNLLTNESGLRRSFIYDNGQYSFFNGHAIDVNNDGDILPVLQGDLRPGIFGPADAFFIYDDGRYFRIADPIGYRWLGITGINDKGQLVGTVHEDRSPQFPGDIVPSYQIIATPERRERKH